MNTKILHVQNVNFALSAGLDYLRHHGERESSRNGPVLVAPGPVITEYAAPTERVMFSPLRDANPFFHLTEALWMLAGRNQIGDLTPIVKTFGQFSDDGETMPAAYGHRWRNHFGHDQLWEIAEELCKNPATRQCVLAMWDAGSAIELGSELVGACGTVVRIGDLTKVTKDKPCNTHAYFRIRNGALDLTVLCRSNDAVWGAHGANAVHFSVLQEWMAAAVQVKVGTLYQVSNNYHVYEERPDVKRLLDMDTSSVYYIPFNLYNHVQPAPLLTLGTETAEDFLLDCEKLFEGHRDAQFYTRFFNYVYVPMMEAWRAYEAKDYEQCAHLVTELEGNVDWHVDAARWLKRRLKRAPA